jgi:hypothetical protein
MTFTLVAFKDLSDNFDRKVLSLLGKHNAQTVEQLPEHRRIPVRFLQIAIEELKAKNWNSKHSYNAYRGDNSKSLILSGLMYIIMKEIETSSGSGSFLRRALQEVIGITEEDKEKGIKANPLDANSEYEIIRAALKFFQKTVFEGGDASHPLRAEHAFSPIQGFNVLSFALKSISLQEAAHARIYREADEALQQFIQAEARRNAPPSLFDAVGNLFWSSKPPLPRGDNMEERNLPPPSSPVSQDGAFTPSV